MQVANQSAQAEPVTLDMEKQEIPEQMANKEDYKARLRATQEVQKLTDELDVQDINSILQFGQKPSEEISKLSDELLNQMKAVNATECSEMITQLTKIMDKFDIKEIESGNESALDKLFNKAKKKLEEMFQKYDTMGKEVDKIYVILKKYESDLHKSNDDLAKMQKANVNFYEQLEKYIVAGEIGIEEIDAYKSQVETDPNTPEEKRQMIISQLNNTRDMLSQRILDLQIAENVAMQTCPMIQTMQTANFNLLRKINSSFIITLPIFKQCLIQAITLKRQQIVGKSMQALDDKTNELLTRNAQNTASQSVAMAQMAGSSSIKIETLRQNYQIIQQGIEETKRINEQLATERAANSKELEEMKADMRSKGFV